MTKLNKTGMQTLIDADLAWLGRQYPSWERSHITQIVKALMDSYQDGPYDDPTIMRMRLKEAEEKLSRSVFAAHGPEERPKGDYLICLLLSSGDLREGRYRVTEDGNTREEVVEVEGMDIVDWSAVVGWLEAEEVRLKLCQALSAPERKEE